MKIQYYSDRHQERSEIMAARHTHSVLLSVFSYALALLIVGGLMFATDAAVLLGWQL